MIWDKFKNNEGMYVRLRPPARGLSISDGDWIVAEVNKQQRFVTLSFPPTGHTVHLNGDHIRNYVSDSTRGNDDQKFGFLLLEVELTFDGLDVHMEPLRREQQGVPWAIEDKIISNTYIERSALRQKYERLSWANENRVAALEEEGLQVVYEEDGINRKMYRLVRRGQVLMGKS